MTVVTTWTALQTEATLLDTELDGITTTSLTAAGTALASNIYPLCIVNFEIDHAVAPSAGGAWDFWLLASPDGGTSYPDLDVVTMQPWITLPVAANTNLQVITRFGVELPSGHFKAVGRNRSGQSSTGTANLLTIARYGLSTA